MSQNLMIVDDSTVARFAAALSAGKRTSAILPARISDCALTAAQRATIRTARKERHAADMKAYKKRFADALAAKKKAAQKKGTKSRKPNLTARERRIRAMTQDSKWRGPFLQGGAPGLVQQK